MGMREVTPTNLLIILMSAGCGQAGQAHVISGLKLKDGGRRTRRGIERSGCTDIRVSRRLRENKSKI